MAQKNKVSDSLKAIAENNAKRMGTNVITLGDFVSHAMSQVMDSIFTKGTIIIVPTKEEIEATPGLIGFDVFTSNGRTSKAPYIWCDSNFGPKKLFVSQLVRTQSIWKEENGGVVRTANTVDQGTNLYKTLREKKDAGAILEPVLGKSLEVVDVKMGKTASYTAGVPTGLRDFNLACFEIKD